MWENHFSTGDHFFSCSTGWGSSMCMIEVMGFSQENKFHYCPDCIIYKIIGNCQYLRACETNQDLCHGKNLVEVAN